MLFSRDYSILLGLVNFVLFTVVSPGRGGIYKEKYMVFNSFPFLIFFTIVLFLYYVIPIKYRYLVLLLASYYFYGYSNLSHVPLLFLVTLISFVSGKAISSSKSKKKQKNIVILSASLLIFLLLSFKYQSFIFGNINLVFKTNISIDAIIIPLGISFFILQAISYPIDLYRGDVKEENNFLRFALFVSFFPQILSGPISKSKEMLPQINENHKYESKNILDGLLIVLYGLFKKVVIADLLAVGVDNVFNNLHDFVGIPLIVAVFLYSLQIYFDFSSYSNIAYGCGKMLGFELNKNFDTPYFADSLKSFWSRWHISLSTWFRDYLYFPLGGNRKGKARSYLNLIIVFLASALWHGGAWTYLMWGGIHALYQIAERQFKLSFKNNFLNVIKTYLLVTFAWIFFRARTLDDARYVIANMFKFNFNGILSQLKSIGWDRFDLIILALSALIVFTLDFLNYKKEMSARITKLNYKFKLLIYLILIFTTLIFGHYGPGFDKADFIYLGY